MNKEILRQANNKLKKLSKKYDGFLNVVVDDWRGFRFVFDSEDVRQCSNQCDRCPLYLLLKDEKLGRFSAGLYPASRKDRDLFGKQNYLNCKTLDQYRDCYVSFLIKEARTKKQIQEELNLIKKLAIIFCKKGDRIELEKSFKKSIITKSLEAADENKKTIIRDFMIKNSLI